MTPTTALPPSAAASSLPAGVSAVAHNTAPVRLAAVGSAPAPAAAAAAAAAVEKPAPVVLSPSNGVGAGMNGGAQPGGVEPKKKKKKKKKASGSLLLPGSDGTFRDQALENAEAQIAGDDADAWRARAVARVRRLAQVSVELSAAREELATAVARYTDAEVAERAVNSGLRGAKLLLEQREKAAAAAAHANASLTAEVSALTDERRKTDKRLLLLKTVSEKLQATRDERDALERKCDDAAAAMAKLRADAADAAAENERLRAAERELACRVEEVAALSAAAAAAEAAEPRKMRAVAALGAAAGAAACVVLRALVPRGAGRDQCVE